MKLLKALLILCILVSNHSLATSETEQKQRQKRVSTCSWLRDSANDLVQKSRKYIQKNMHEIKEGIIIASPFFVTTGYVLYMAVNGCYTVGAGCMGSMCSPGRIVCPE